MKTKADLQFQIDQLRKDKIIYAVESVAISLASIVMYLFTIIILPNMLLKQISAVALVIALGYWAYMGIGNLFRLKKIKTLEKKLSNL